MPDGPPRLSTYVTAEGSPPVHVLTTGVRPPQEAAGQTTTALLTQLLRTAGRVAGEQSRQLRRLGLSPSAFAVLLELASTPAEGLQPCDLAERLSVSRPSVCGLIDGLEAKGLVTRRPHEHDGRRVLVTLSADGGELLDRHRDPYEASLDALLADLTPSERTDLAHLLERIGH